MRHNLAVPGAFCRGCESDKSLLNCKIVVLAWYSLNLPLRLGAQPQNPVLGLPDLAWLSRFFQPEWNFLNHLVTVIKCTFIFHTTNTFSCFCGIMAESNTQSMNSKIRLFCTLIWVTFKSFMEWKQCTTCQHTNYHDTTHHSGYLQSYDICCCKVALSKILQNFWLTLAYVLLSSLYILSIIVSHL